MGIAFAPDGWMYVYRGNGGGQAWRLTGTDSSALDGYDDGGNIVRARTDGSELLEVATGFWNPFHIFVDSDGRLIATDNPARCRIQPACEKRRPGASKPTSPHLGKPVRLRFSAPSGRRARSTVFG